MLTPLQQKVASVLKPYRDPTSYVAGGAALNLGWTRLSDDMDVFLDHANRLKTLVNDEINALKEAGFSVQVEVMQDPYTAEVLVSSKDEETRIQWIVDPEASRRYFPAKQDDVLGYRLDQADVAVNKVLCSCARRTAARDAIDLINIVESYAPLGPLVWAVVGKRPELGPLGVIRQLRSIVFGYSDQEIRTVRMASESVTRDHVRAILEPALERAEHYCTEIAPIDGYDGCLFVDSSDMPVEADERAIASAAVQAKPLIDFSADSPEIGLNISD